MTELLEARAAEHGSRVAFRFLSDGDNETSQITYEELSHRARCISRALLRHKAAGERALLFYPAGPDFIAAFWGCIYAGVIAVPVFPARLQRHLPRLLAIQADCEAQFLLTTSKICGQAQDLLKRAPALEKLEWLAADEASATGETTTCNTSSASLDSLALLQYTSGSTATPRGVMVTHGNLLHNLACLRDVFGFSAHSIGVTWLPHFHDMGLVGGLLQPLYVGGEMILMPPSCFLQQPLRWLAAATRYRATTLVAPNFAYELCAEKISAEQRAGLELASVEVALCGAEPVRAGTLSRFAEAFGACGFRRDAFRPAYGLAEATLIVSGRSGNCQPLIRFVSAAALQQHKIERVPDNSSNARTLVGCGGIAPELSVEVVDPATSLPCSANQVGEIWVSGPSVAHGYWRKPEETAHTFEAHLANGHGPFLRTGDLGFVADGQLFVTGRQKDLIIIRGSNHYPQDLEHTVERSHRALRPSCGAVFSAEMNGIERLVVVHEIEDKTASTDQEIVAAIRRALTEAHEVQPDAVVLIEPRTIPRTSSGKVQRFACREAFLAGSLDVVREWRDEEALNQHGESGSIERRSGLVWDWSASSSSHGLAGRAQTNGNGQHSGPQAGKTRQSSAEPIAIVGLGCRFPGAADFNEFWLLLRNGVDAITEIPRQRWDVDALYDPNPGILCKMSTRWGGFLPDVDQFDPYFFGISPREASAMDPQQRLLLEVAWEALENAGQAPDQLAGTRTGVYVGIGGFDYTNVLLNYEEHLRTINAYVGTGNAHAIAANRISYLLDLRGPSVAIDTACSSALVAIHMACEGLRSGETDLALAGGVNLILSPEVTIAFSHARMMAADGRCKTFDARADGYARAEGCGVVVLKRVSEALKDRDQIHAVIRGSAVNQDGRTAGIAAPNGTAQQAVIREALSQAGVAPRELTYIEAHGTGTSVGDPIELEAIKNVLGEPGADDVPCVVGSVKANIGHLENASGMAGLAKVVGCIQNGEIPGQLHLTQLNPRISLEGTRVIISNQRQRWPETPRRIAGISSFGFGGTNAHLVVEQAPQRKRPDAPAPPRHLLTLSARTETALKALAKRYANYFDEHPGAAIQDVCFTASAGRSHFAHRLAAIGASQSDLRDALIAYAEGRWAERDAQKLHSGHATRKDGPRIAFLLGGTDGFDRAAASEFYATAPAFRQAVERCASAAGVQGSGAQPSFFSENALGAEGPEGRDVALFAAQYALSELWRFWGIEPDTVLGCGVGEYAAAASAGIFSVEDGIRLVRERSRLLQHATNDGAWDLMLDGFERTAAAVRFEQARVPFVASLTGEAFGSSGNIPGPAYWRKQIAAAPQLDKGLQALAARGCEVFLQLGNADGLFAKRQSSAGEQAGGSWLASFGPGAGAWDEILASVSALYVGGASLNWQAFHELYKPLRMSLPTYPFERERCWQEAPTESHRAAARATEPHPLLGIRINSALAMPQFQSTIGMDAMAYLADHRVQGSAVFPAAAYLEMAREAASELLGAAGPVALSNVTFQEAMILPAAGSRAVQLIGSPAAGGSASFQVCSSTSDESSAAGNTAWTLHASGDLRVAPEGPHESRPACNLTEIRERCPRQKSADQFYESLRHAGLAYGPRFRGVQQLWCGQGEAVAEISLAPPAHSNGTPGKSSNHYWIHPALLDSCLQTLAAALPEENARDTRKRVYLPAGVSEARFFSRPGGRLFSHCVLRSSDSGAGLFEADIRLLDSEGLILAEILGFRVRQVAGETGASNRQKPADLLYDLTWVQKRADSSPVPASPESRSWLIIADRGGLGEALAAELRGRSEVCSVVRSDDPRDMSLYSSCTSIVDLSGLDIATSGDALPQAQMRWSEMLSFIQELIRTRGSAHKRLWLVTRGAQSAGTAKSPVSLAQTPLWGLAKSLDLEHPELRCTRIDLDPAAGADEIRMLAAELQIASTEREVAFRKGTRYVARLLSRAAKKSSRTVMAIPDGDAFRLDISKPGDPENLVLRATTRTEPKEGEVEIRVQAAGLNFRDVMNAAGVYPGGPIPFGAECAGTISAVGPGVADLKTGDEVIAVASGTFASFVTADARAVVRKPRAMNFGQAATIPITFLTAYYSLQHLARLSRGERVLIHAAAGGVGLAAVQLAQRAGAEIFATAGAPEKRAFLKSLRVPHILDSRSLGFADEIVKRTNGRGVDVVLNSLPGEYIARSLSVLSPHGRFVEIGRTDIYQNKQLGLFPFRNNLSYFALDLERVCRERPELVRSMLLELMALFEKGVLQPLYHQIFFIEDAANAFRHMARRKNIGKVVLSLPNPKDKTRAPRALSVRADATYLITGGSGALGLATARWLVEKGARHVALLSRGGVSAESQTALEMTGRGAIIRSLRADVANQAELRRAFDQIPASMPPLRGIIHAAGLLDDRLFLNLDPESLKRVLEPKVLGAWNLHAASAGMPLDFFVLFSSIASVLGSPGQANYAAANAFLDALAHERRAKGLPALSINWGPWAGLGMAARTASSRGVASRVMQPIPPEQAFAALDYLFEKTSAPEALVMAVDWTQFARSFNGDQPPALVADLIREKASQPAGNGTRESGPRLSATDVLATPTERRHALLLGYVQKSLAQVMSLNPADLDPEESLSTLGLDSLMALELQHSLEETFGAKLPLDLLMGMPTLNEFVARVLEILVKSPVSPARNGRHPGEKQAQTSESSPPAVEA